MGDEKARLGLAFMYNAPGSLKDQQDKKSDQKNNEDSINWEKASLDAAAKNKDKVSTNFYKIL